MKRLLDLVIILIFLVLLGWLLLLLIIISAFVHKSSGLYRQTRIGKDQNVFKLFKIQSMRAITGFNSSVSTKNDPRVTRYGNFIRKFKLDELPQIFNVLNGTMSIVGPRPTVLEDANLMNTKQRERFSVKPGLTGLAQINGNTSLSWPKRIEFDIEYINNQSIILDLQIIYKTVILILTNKAETHPKYDDEWKE
jgi:lipopolysaccharide/colanic/teichoic acid biosynthesis glycosyltransferase